MNKPKDYDSISIGSTQLPPGGYVCKILQVKETKSRTGKDMLVISFDVAEGDYAEHFSRLYKNDAQKEKKWKGNYYILLTNNEGATTRDFKRFCEFTEQSNKGFEVSWGSGFEKCFVGKLIGIVFGREQFAGYNGPAWSCKPRGLYTIDDIKNGSFTVPEDKPMQESPTDGNFFFNEEDKNAEEVELPF